MKGITTPLLYRGSGPVQMALQSELPPTPAQVQDMQMGDRVFLLFDLQAITPKLHEHELSQAH